MAPIPQVTKKKLTRAQPQTVSTDNVVDDLGRTLTYLNRRQKSLDQQQDKKTTIARQHAAQNESDTSKNVLTYRDVFPGRKYKLTLNDVSWITGQNTLDIGYTVGDTFTSISYSQDDNTFEFELPDAGSTPSVPLIDTVEVRMTGVSSAIRGYMEDNTDSKSLWAKIAELLLDVADLKDRMSAVENRLTSVEDAISGTGGIYDQLSDLDDRVTALENE